MTTPYLQPMQSGAKCPHGFPVGTCPICSGTGGGGGVSKDKNKPRVAGEMSYNECMAAWIKIQAARDAKIQDKIELRERALERTLENRAMAGLDKIAKVLDKAFEPLPNVIKIPLKAVTSTIINVIAKVTNVLINTVKTLQNIGQNVLNFISQTAEKLSSALGEAKNFVQSFFKGTLKKSIKTFLSLFSESAEEEEEDIKDKLKTLLNLFIKKENNENKEKFEKLLKSKKKNKVS